ncbi:hypothetical protein C1645_828321 [Glomus cerebriforme]|uniref:HAT C-terminal dimerisation domain-containing protein n=1 Tax=Glomus cerebriforme TaxID=658196 RepID=A0A397SQ82_9GLOM|nr:hypothetical protein C1645_828321 [Glomus cerebriforme]
MDHADSLSKTRVKAIIEGRNFWSDLKILAFVLDLLHKAILALEARKVTLADCFLSFKFYLQKQNALYSQLRKYKDKEAPFDLEFATGYEEPINWWNLIDTSPDPDSLPRIARHLFSICPNSASCERGFLV